VPYADTKLTELEHTQRWISGIEYDAAILVDRLDTLKMIYDPTSPYVEQMRKGAARKWTRLSCPSSSQSRRRARTATRTSLSLA